MTLIEYGEKLGFLREEICGSLERKEGPKTEREAAFDAELVEMMYRALVDAYESASGRPIPD